MEIGLYTFAELSPDPQTGEAITPQQRVRDLMEEIELADQLGLDVFGVGEHHRPDFVVSSPAVILGAAAARTERIRLSSAVTVLSSDDPVRVFQDFATVDLLSGGRAEIMVGRGSFIESFPLFGYDLDDYDELFAEKLELLLRAARVRDGHLVRPAPARAPRVGASTRARSRTRCRSGSPWVARRGRSCAPASLGLPLALAIIGGSPERFVPLVELYRQAATETGHPGLPVGINSHTYVADSAKQAADEFFPAYAGMMNRIGRERGWPPMTRRQFDELRGLRGALVVGGPQEVVEKILFQHELFGHQRFLAQISVGHLPHAKAMRAIELLGTEVVPAVRAEIGASAHQSRPAYG